MAWPYMSIRHLTHTTAATLKLRMIVVMIFNPGGNKDILMMWSERGRVANTPAVLKVFTSRSDGLLYLIRTYRTVPICLSNPIICDRSLSNYKISLTLQYVGHLDL
jgi:hypothetical protein